MAGDGELGPQVPDFEAFLEAHRSEILEAYARNLAALDSPISRDPTALRQALANAEQILDDVAETLRSGSIRVGDSHKIIAWEVGATRAASGVHPDESLRAASVWFQAVVTCLLERMPGDAESMRLLTLVVLGLERSITTRIRESSASYSSFLLDKVHEAQVEERRRIARELHDRLGHGLSVAHRQLELYDLHRANKPATATAKVETAQQAILETMQNLRAVTSELHPQEPLNSLEKALLYYLETVDMDEVDIRLRVSGDETWASPTVRDESFLILREAARNALSHGNPSKVLIRVDFAPHELRASVDDDGLGFTEGGGGRSDGVGLLSMQERAAIIGGTTTITSRPGHGTHVELYVPFSGLTA
ncbi:MULTISPECIES: sensor histidine kinase [unclassified Microbispora]|uniref:sensor histidine kinase n=1 Tax=unclassified Microbispora TaxID=2614687 RepID=UPI0014733DCC|nr:MULTISPECIES: histidine kinase [unclassified Microbispora]